MIHSQLSSITPDLRGALGRTVTLFLDLLKKQIEATNKYLVELGERPQTLPDRQTIERCVLDVANHLDWHLRVYKVTPTEIDFFKVGAWLGMHLYHASGRGFDTNDIVTVLNEALIQDGRSLPQLLRQKIACMLANDKTREHLRGNGKEPDVTFHDLAICMNGLYMIFRASLEAELFLTESAAA